MLVDKQIIAVIDLKEGSTLIDKNKNVFLEILYQNYFF